MDESSRLAGSEEEPEPWVILLCFASTQMFLLVNVGYYGLRHSPC